MAAELIEIIPDNPDMRKIKRVVDCLEDGGIIIYPTDTVYSMGCNSYNTKAVERLCKIKGIKPNQNKFSIVCHDLSDIATYARVSNEAFRLMKQYLPGPYTFILPSTGELPRVLQTNRKTIGIRVPDHNIPHTLIRELGKPIITSSVKYDEENILEYPNEIEVIYEENQYLADIIIDGGWSGIIPSTIIDCTDPNHFEVVREGLGEVEF